MRKLLRYLSDYKKESILAPLFKMLEASFELFVPLVVAAIIDRGIGAEQTGYVLRMGLLLVLLALIGLACSATAQYFSARAAVGFAADVRSRLFAHIQTLSYTDLDGLGTSTMITRMTSDINQVQTGVNLTLRLLLRSPFVVFGAMIMAFTVNAKAALVFAVIIPLLCVVVFGIMLFNIPMYRRVQMALDRVVRQTRENLTGARVVRAFNRQEAEVEAYRESTGALNRIQILAGRISALMNPVTYVIINLGIIVLIRQGAFQVDQGVITQGQLTALVNYMSQILVELVKMANLIISITKAWACGNRIQAVFEIRPSMSYGTAAVGDTAACDAPLLELKGAGLRYRGAGDASLENVNLTVLPGQTIGIIGGTGAGKTTLAGLIARFYDATEGEVCLLGRPIGDYAEEALRGVIGVVPQQALLFSGTIRDNLRWGKEDASEEELWEVLRIAQADAFVRERPAGLDAQIEQEGRNLSGGQRQRLTIARALLRKPKLLILDDSTSALDFATDAALRRAIREMEPHPALFLISQRASSIQYADQILVLEDGEVAGEGTHEVLLSSCQVYREIYESQFPKEGE